MSGIVGWRRKLERREKTGRGQYLEAKDTLETRTEAKLLEKTTWFKGNMKRKLENKESTFQYHPPSKRRKTGKQSNNKGGTNAVKSVMFFPFTAHSELASRLRENEEKMQQMTGYRLMIVEKAGTKLVDMLHKVNPWAGEDCKRNRGKERRIAKTATREMASTKPTADHAATGRIKR